MYGVRVDLSYRLREPSLFLSTPRIDLVPPVPAESVILAETVCSAHSGVFSTGVKTAFLTATLEMQCFRSFLYPVFQALWLPSLL